MPDVREHDVGEHLSFSALHMMGENLWAAEDYRSLNEEEKARYDTFAEAYFSNCEARAPG